MGRKPAQWRRGYACTWAGSMDDDELDHLLAGLELPDVGHHAHDDAVGPLTIDLDELGDFE